MTREEAIEILKAHHMWTGEPQEIIDIRKENKALEMAIKALSQEPCDDKVISLERAKKQIGRWIGYIDQDMINRICISLEQLPSVTQKSGGWINDKNDIPICSRCGYIPQYDRAIDDYEYSNYCPNCGAKMESEDKDANSN